MFVFFDVWPRLLCCLIIVATCIVETYRSVGLLLVGIQSRWGQVCRAGELANLCIYTVCQNLVVGPRAKKSHMIIPDVRD